LKSEISNINELFNNNQESNMEEMMQLMEHQNLKDRRKKAKLQKSKSKQQAKRHGSDQKSRPGKNNAIEIEQKKKWSVSQFKLNSWIMVCKSTKVIVLVAAVHGKASQYVKT